MAQVAKLIGGAGTGKTRKMMEVLETARKNLGGSPFSVGFTSMTKAARSEAISRASAAWGVDPEMLGKDGWFRTVHSIAYRQLGIQSGQILDEKADSMRWIADALGVALRTVAVNDTEYVRYAGDDAAALALNAWNLARSRMEPIDQIILEMQRAGDVVPSADRCKVWVDRYESAKRADDRCDFCDLLARFAGVSFSVDGPHLVEPEGDVPLEPQAWVFDEAQDASALIDRCCQRLAAGDRVRWVYLAGDPFQAVFSFGGADAKHFMNWTADKTQIMRKTWRCPKPVLDLGERCLKRMQEGYWDREIAAADHDGDISRTGSVAAALDGVGKEGTALVLARCKYTLEDFTSRLDSESIPWAWIKSPEQTKLKTACRALWDVEHGQWVSGEDWAVAMSMLPAHGNLVRGAKKAWSTGQAVMEFEAIHSQKLEAAGLLPEFAAKIRAGEWGGLFRGAQNWRSSALRFGADAATKPSVRVGTIHAAKGMEADTVVMSTQISRKIEETQSLSRQQHDEECRVQYVGVTRAKRKLVCVASFDRDMRLPL